MSSGENSKTMKSQSNLIEMELDGNNFQNEHYSIINQVNAHEDIQPMSDGGISQNNQFIIPPPRSANDIIDRGEEESFHDKNEGQDTSQQGEERESEIKVKTKPHRRLFFDDQTVYQEMIIPKNIVFIYAKKIGGLKITLKRNKPRTKHQYFKGVFQEVLNRMKEEFKK